MPTRLFSESGTLSTEHDKARMAPSILLAQSSHPFLFLSYVLNTIKVILLPLVQCLVKLVESIGNTCSHEQH